MPRCGLPAVPAAAVGALLALAALLAPAAAGAQAPRQFPADALRGMVLFDTPPNVRLNGQAAMLAPGARIHGLDNMIKMSGAVAGQQYLVNYTRERATGLLLEVWLLRDDEARRQPWPQTPQEAATWAFDPVGQAWTRP